MPFLLLMPSYNQAHYIGDAVRSILAQDDPDWELWIVDNSSDDTPRVMAQFSDPRIRFHHIPERMDPGSCLNWMLERAQGRDFSYVHSDNNLQPGYVRVLRKALARDPLSLAYCDMRIIDGAGRRRAVEVRGSFDLPRLLSLSPLGAPFAATTALAKKIGGFSADDIADDVQFCTRAWGVARFVYVPDPLLDYRLHGQSRTEAIGSDRERDRLFIRTHARLLPLLEERQLAPLDELTGRLRTLLHELDWFVENYWSRDLEARYGAWWEGTPTLATFVAAGLAQLPSLGSRGELGRPPQSRWDGHWHPPWRLRKLLRRTRGMRQHIATRAVEIRRYLLSWACLSAGQDAPGFRFALAGGDVRTIWGAALLESGLGWSPVLAADCAAPEWVPWQADARYDAVLDLSDVPSLTRA